MNTTMCARIALCLMVAAPLIVAGCGTSPPSKFYALNAVKTQQSAAQATSAARSVLLSVGPIRIPDYLDRPQIVTHTAQNELTINEFERWGGSLREDIDRVVTEDLSALLASEDVAVVSWRSTGPGGYKLPIALNRFDAVLGGSVQLKATWGVSSVDGMKIIFMSESAISQPVNGTSYSAIVAAMSQALGTMSQEIAAGVKSLLAAGTIKAVNIPAPDSGKAK